MIVHHRGHSLVGKARPCQGRDRGFESRCPLTIHFSLFTPIDLLSFVYSHTLRFYVMLTALCAQIFGPIGTFCGALGLVLVSVRSIGVSRAGVEFVPLDTGVVCGRGVVVRFGRRCVFVLPWVVGNE